MAAEESIFPDAPETPAPVFAYRALKGFIFGSPNDEKDDNKENEPPVLAQHAKLWQNTTPQKRKRGGAGDFSSPVKSILRPSGVATPRALQLQSRNVGVTFKDLRKSLSPEIKRKEQPSGHNLDTKRVKVENPSIESRGLPFAAAQNLEIAPRANLSTKVFVKETTSSIASVQSALTQGISFDIEAYKQSTEKEMKKLVRYGQKMREYARKQDEENAKLRQALDECQRENERLTRAEEERQTRPLNGGGVELTKEIYGVAQLLPKANRQHTRCSDVGKKVAKIEAATSRLDTGGRKVSETSEAGDPTRLISNNYRNIEVPEITFQTERNAKGLFTHTTERKSSARLRPDRLAAARERIRVKSEKRKVSEMEQSQVDWAGL